MENPMTAATSQQQQQPQMQKKKKSKNKKGNKSAPAEVGTALDLDSAKKPEFNANGLSEQLAHELQLNNTNSSSNSNNNNNNRNNINSTASSDKFRKGNKLTNGTATKELPAPHHVNGHDNSAAAALKIPAETNINGSASTEMQRQQQHQQQGKKTKSKNKQKHKECDKGINCHQICVNKEQSTSSPDTVEKLQVLGQEHVETLNNGFCSATEKDVEEASSFKQNTNENINKETQELKTNSEATQAEQPQKQQELKAAAATIPASIANSEADFASTYDADKDNAASPTLDLSNVHIEYKEYESELQMHDIMRLIQAELSEPYSIYTYRYFIYNWPKLCFLAAHGNEYVGAIVCKLDRHMNVKRGYIAMLAVRKEYRKLKIGTTLVQKAIEAMLADNADEVVLETEMRNLPALRLYENLGFVRDKRLFRYYLNGVDALRLKLWFR